MYVDPEVYALCHLKDRPVLRINEVHTVLKVVINRRPTKPKIFNGSLELSSCLVWISYWQTSEACQPTGVLLDNLGYFIVGITATVGARVSEPGEVLHHLD